MRSMTGERTGVAGAVALLVFAGMAATACDGSILDASDPDIVTPDQLEGPAAVENRLAGILFDFRETYDFHVLLTGVMADEYIHVGSFPGHENADDREPAPGDLSPQQEWVTPLATTQKTTDELIEDFEASLDDPDFASVRERMLDGIALAHLLRGYDLLFWGESFCQSILDQQDETSAKLPADRIEEDALTALNDAIPAAQAASGGSLDLTAEPNDVATAAKVGLARAHMFLGNFGQALTWAQDALSSSPTHTFVIDYSANTNDEINSVYGRTFGDVLARRWSVGIGNDPGSNFETYAYTTEFMNQGLIVQRPDLDAQSDGPINLQQLYDERSSPILVSSAWEAKMIEAEVLWRQNDVGQAETMINDLLEGDLGIPNPMGVVNPDIEAQTGADLDGWRTVTLTGNAANDLNEIGFARAAGLWQSGQRATFLRRIFREDGVDMWPDRGGNAMSFPLFSFELDNNENVSSGCPGGQSIPGQG